MKKYISLLSLIYLFTDSFAYSSDLPLDDGRLYYIRSKQGRNVLSFYNADSGPEIIGDRVEHIPAPDTNHHQKFRLERTAAGDYYIKNRSGRLLNFYNATSPVAGEKVEHLPTAVSDHQNFLLIPTEDGYFLIRNRYGRIMNFYGDETPGNHTVEHVPGPIVTGSYPYEVIGSPHNHQKFRFEPIFRLTAIITDFKYGSLVSDWKTLLGSKAEDVSMSEFNFSNDSDLPQTQRLHIRKTKQNTLSWDFTRSTESSFFNQLDVEISAKFFGIGGSAHNTTVWSNRETSLEQRKETTLDETTIAQDTTIAIPPRSHIECLSTWKTIDADLPFEAMVKVMGLAEYPNGFRPVSAKETRMFLSQKGYTGNIAGEEGESILARITGSIHVKGALSGTVHVKQTPIQVTS